MARLAMALCTCVALFAAPGVARDNRSEASVSTRDIDVRARALVGQMTLDEKIAMLHGSMPIALPGRPNNTPADALPSAGYIPGVARLGIPPLRETDASLGVTNPLGLRKGDTATALPSGLSLASSFDPDLAYRAGAMVGAEARAKGFNVLLNGGANLARDPRNGRNFEYLGEDPLLAGVLAGETVRGAQAQGIIATVKHFALNDNETNRHSLDARIDRGALRESDLLAFQIAIERGRPGAVMCAYNKINGEYSCSNHWLLNDVLKGDWHFAGWVMSDWGAVHSVDDALAGLDQQSGEQFDPAVFFGAPLKVAVESGRVPVARIDDMVARILRSMIAAGLLDRRTAAPPTDVQANAAVALQVARQGIVLLKNDGGSPATIGYDEGANVGYRWYASRSVQPRYPFGYGLSFSRFSTQGLKVVGGAHPVATVTARNNGLRAGAEVVQIYLQVRPKGPAVRLLGFARVELQPGESQRVRIPIDPRLFADFDEARRTWRVAPGAYRIAVGNDASHLTQSTLLKQAGRAI